MVRLQGAGSVPLSHRITPICFFCVSAAYKLAWTALSSMLEDLGSVYGPQVLLYLNIAYFFPSIPVLLLQTVFNEPLVRLCGLPQITLAKFAAGLGGLSVASFMVPHVMHSQQELLVMTIVIGICYGLAFGTSYQIVSRFSAADTIALTTGFVSSGLVVLVLDTATAARIPLLSNRIGALFTWVAGLTLVGLAAAVLLVALEWKMLAIQGSVAGRRGAAKGKIIDLHSNLVSLASKGGSSGWSVGGGAFRQRTYGGGSQVGSGGAFGGGQAAQHSPTTDSYAAIDMMEQAVGPSDNGHPNPHPHHGNTVLAPRHHDGLHPAAGGGGSLGTTGLSGELDDKLEKRKGGGGVGGAAALLTTARRIWPSALSLFLSVGTSMLVFPFFSYIKGTGPIGPTLPKVLFYIRLLSDIVARIVPPRLQTRSPGVLLLWSLIKTALVPVLLAAMLRPAAFFGDVGLVVLVSSFWVLSGYINTCAYLLAPAAVPPEAKPQAGGLMTVTFQLSCFVALLAAWVLHERVTRVPAADPPVILW